VPGLREAIRPTGLPALRARILEVEVLLPDVPNDVFAMHAVTVVAMIVTLWMLQVPTLAPSALADASGPPTFEGLATPERRVAVEEPEMCFESGCVDGDVDSALIDQTSESGVT
jgi:hypothetical protein